MKTSPLFSQVLADLFPAVIAVGLQLAAGTVEDVAVPPVVLLVTALGGYCVYAADHARGTSRSSAIPLKATTISVALAAVLLLAASLLLPGVRLLAVGLYILFSILYVIPLSKNLPRLQDLPILRSLAIPIGWALIPFLNQEITGTVDEWIWISGMALLLATAHVLSDWKDAAEDRAHARPTLASGFSHHTVRLVCWVLLTASTLLFCIRPSTRVMTPGPLLLFCHTTLKGMWQTAKVGDFFLLWAWIAWLAAVIGLL